MADVMTPMAIRVAATLGVADRIAAGTRTAPELAKETGAHAEALDRVMRHLAAVGVLVRDASGRYEVSEKGGPLRSDHPGSIRPFLDIDGAMGRGDVAFANLLHSVRTGEAAFTAQFGVSFWDDLAADPSAGRRSTRRWGTTRWAARTPCRRRSTGARSDGSWTSAAGTARSWRRC
ncbi:hypothetical protein [Actinomadura sp. J1-007]|uniref:methyltransferase family protein n=1 Tax=Actinomadura sp. J1-007 TaxID=2661913 RepID=UPI0028157B4C|nr:hypothetical protein [Actinomadura sp. J1-007]